MEPQLQEPKNGDHRLILFLVLGSILTPLTLIVILRALKIF